MVVFLAVAAVLAWIIIATDAIVTAAGPQLPPHVLLHLVDIIDVAHGALTALVSDDDWEVEAVVQVIFPGGLELGDDLTGTLAC